MDVLVVDLTHGGVKIAVELEKLGQFENIYAYDIYNTLNENERNKLDSYNIIIWNNEKNVLNYLDLKDKDVELLVINPIHSYFNIFDLDNNINKNYNNTNKGDNINNKDNIIIGELTHHQGVNLILDKWKNTLNQKIPIIEVTGVKGKTSVVSMLKEVLIHKNPLVLSSLGANLYKNGKKIILKKNISITPASILETVKLAKKIADPDCIKIDEFGKLDKPHYSIESKGVNDLNSDLCYGACIFESSLGVTGLGDVGVLTNVVENYSIAKNSSNAKNAKEQVFNCDIVIIEKETLERYYSEKINTDYNHNNYKINTFSFNDKNANLFAEKVEFDLKSTNIKIIYNNIKTNSGEIIGGDLIVDTFAPGEHHVLNVLATVSTALSCNIDKNIIINGLANFNGIKGRTSLKTKEKQIIIEEINPGINTKAIEKSISMINNINDYVVIFGGKYGVTCEEINENKVANLFDDILYNLSDISDDELNKNEKDIQLNNKFNLILTDDLGKEIGKKMKYTVKFIEDPIEAQNLAISNKKNVLFIYRSNYSQIDKR